MDNKILLYGHRGIGQTHLENTMVAFRKAIEGGVDGLETDIQMTRDGHLILMHDNMVDRTTDGTGFVCEKTLMEIKNLTIGDGERVPLLSELLDLATEHPDLLLNLEIKTYPDLEGESWTWETVGKTIQMVEAYGLAEQSVFTSFSTKVLAHIEKKYNSRYRLQGFYPYFVMREKELVPEVNLYSACMYYILRDENGKWLDTETHLCPKDWFDLLQGKGIQPWLCTAVKSKEELALAIERGARAVTSDDPLETLSILRSLGVHR